jgi:hypothetical protein
LNVYSPEEKTQAFKKIYQNGINVDPTTFTTYLGRYFNYMKWVDDHFQVSSFFNYEKDMQDLDGYVSKLDIFPSNNRPRTWKEIFGISWDQWNACHYLNSAKHQAENIPQLEHSPRMLLPLSKDEQYEIQQMHQGALSVQSQNFLIANINSYQTANLAISELVEDKILVTPIPIKLQTLAEKAMIVKNFSEIVEVYNNWCNKNNIQMNANVTDLADSAIKELRQLYNTIYDTK